MLEALKTWSTNEKARQYTGGLVADGPDHPGQRRRYRGNSRARRFSHDSAHDADVPPDYPESQRKAGNDADCRDISG
ncbi:hypothetical protein ACU4HD_15180 [Cupriavidus basilensis]